ncbi:hypothetical protein [Halpernia frigidisoli]|uniref:Uncharacterized protein n=1 Tax=Halpernia frigidisoli TaxID=1125876 RepID=A0A1I3I2K5_9FLAO|nr:hypothetical protein [Halpernia frigidisoli]SFI42204.1 hypothetical protein SAMN05443292_2530 [Halpernia frigidisoli]
MKNIFTLAALFVATFIFAQTPNLVSYQSIVRNSTNDVVKNQSVGIKFSVLKTTTTGTVVYSETQTKTTNANGLVDAQLGAGTVVSGTFSTIDWASDKYFIKTEIDPAGGTNYNIAGTQQLLSVPYALNAKNGVPTGGTTGQVLSKTDGTNYNAQWTTPATGTTLPDQTSNAGKVLTTDGANLSWGNSSSGGASYEVYATITVAQTTAVGSSLNLPSGVVFSSNTSPATLTGNNTFTTVTDPNVAQTQQAGTMNPNISKFTATTAGLYFVDIQLVGNVMFSYPMLDFNGLGNVETSYYGVGANGSTVNQVPHKQRGTLQRLVYMNANDFFLVRAGSGSTVIGVDLAASKVSYIKIVKIK